ncbi:transmembrane protease serine 9-like [Venturia canescens]|uniref:transmembrane protease serine 9-like n=1 Tax=Venturia canescens TaxID=32260 RepID=UPI001C9D23A1|nr:transmembrane protease serine 9-like [Venturia canescens]
MLWQYVLAALLVAEGCLAHVGYQVVNGDDAKPKEFPFIVSIQLKNSKTGANEHLCSGSILSEIFVVTAAHCVKDKSAKDLNVYAGKYYINRREDGQQVLPVKLVIPHQKYDEETKENDIALLHLESPIVLSDTAAKIGLPDSTSPAGPFAMAGWGSMSNTETAYYPRVLQKVTVPIVLNADCVSLMRERADGVKIYESQWCTGPIQGSAAACTGDGGSPLVDAATPTMLYGIVSQWTFPCGTGEPTISTRVLPFVEWLTKSVKPLSKDCSARAGYQIIHGDEAPPHQLPSIVSIMSGKPATGKYKHICGGTILNEKWILTAAHCITKTPPDEQLEVYAGKHIINQREKGQQVSSVRLKNSKFWIKRRSNDLHYRDTGENDIGLLRLETFMKFTSNVKAATLPPRYKIHTGKTVLYGWGSISTTDSPEYPSVLQTITVPIIPKDICYDAVHESPGDLRLFNTQLCTGPDDGTKSACLGDGGGPLVQYGDQANTELVGIVSWGAVPCGSGDPTIYTSVSFYIDWINHHIKNI